MTQAEVAELAGCSQNTVALALRGSTRISSERRCRIRKLAQQLGYRPNVAARSLARQRSGLIGIFTGAMDEVRTDLVAQLIAELHCTEYRPILGVDPGRPAPWYDAPWIESLRDFRVEAMVAIAWTDEVALPDWYRQIPLVMTAIQPDPTLPCDFVGLDRVAAGYDATRYLLGRGHRQIIALANMQRRLVVQGYARAMRDEGLQPDFVALPPAAAHSAELTDVVKRLMAREVPPTAAIVVNSLLALYLCQALREAGVRVPQDMAVIGYDRLPMAGHLHVPLTTIEQPVAEVAGKTVELTRHRLAHPAAPPVHAVVKHSLVRRSSA